MKKTSEPGLDGARLRGLMQATRRLQTYDVPGVGPVTIRSLTERERADLEIAARDDPASLRCRMIVAAVVDQDGLAVFSAGDVEAIGQMDSRITMALSEAVGDHCGVLDADPAADEEAIKN